MTSVLQKLFSLPDVYAKTKSYMLQLDQETEVLENFVQGKLWREKVHNHFKDKFVIPLFIYFDDFEVNNPLGSHAGIQKLGAVYYSIPCFPPEVNSMLENIFVALLFHSSDRIEYKNSSIFNIIIHELNSLQHDGVLINAGNGVERIFFSLGLISGDNLGLNSILGFVEGFSANYYCRLCKSSKLEAQMVFDEKNLINHAESYRKDLQKCDTKRTGIKEESVWDRVNHFKTAQNFFTDWLHEGPEGTAYEDMCLILHYYVTNKHLQDQRLSLNVLNGRLPSFNYSDNAISNPPPLILDKEVHNKCLKMSASKMQNFILIFGMLVGDLVPHDDVWQLYLLLRQIMDIVLSRRVQKSCSVRLRNLVKEHHILFNTIFPDINLKCKAHLWVHYGTILEQSGPIINLSTARFESKHRHKKTEANATSSRKNITHTLCLKEQLVLCYRFMTKRGLVPNNCEGPLTCVDNIIECDNYYLFKNTLPESFYASCLQLNWVKVNGQTYKSRTCVIMHLEDMSDDELLPVFGIVQTIFENACGEILFVCKVVRTTGFSYDVHAYNVFETDTFECVLASNLHSPFSVIMYSWGTESIFATLRHGL